jgi:hypothetical protein
LDEFDLNLTGRLKSSVKVYDVYKHKIDKFDGYLTRNLLSDVKEVLKSKKYVSSLTLKKRIIIKKCFKKTGSVVILKNCNGIAEPGQIVALMGARGCNYLRIILSFLILNI